MSKDISGRAATTLLVFDRATGEIVSVHHMSAAAGTALPDARVLEQHALRTVAAGGKRALHDLGVIAHDARDVDPARLVVDVRAMRVIAREPGGQRT